MAGISRQSLVAHEGFVAARLEARRVPPVVVKRIEPGAGAAAEVEDAGARRRRAGGKVAVERGKHRRRRALRPGLRGPRLLLARRLPSALGRVVRVEHFGRRLRVDEQQAALETGHGAVILAEAPLLHHVHAAPFARRTRDRLAHVRSVYQRIPPVMLRHALRDHRRSPASPRAAGARDRARHPASVAAAGGDVGHRQASNGDGGGGSAQLPGAAGRPAPSKPMPAASARPAAASPAVCMPTSSCSSPGRPARSRLMWYAT